MVSRLIKGTKNIEELKVIFSVSNTNFYNKLSNCFGIIYAQQKLDFKLINQITLNVFKILHYVCICAIQVRLYPIVF